MDISRNQTINIASLNTNRHSVEYCKPLQSIMNSLLEVTNKTFSLVEQDFETDTAHRYGAFLKSQACHLLCVWPSASDLPCLCSLSSVNVGVRTRDLSREVVAGGNEIISKQGSTGACSLSSAGRECPCKCCPAEGLSPSSCACTEEFRS